MLMLDSYTMFSKVPSDLVLSSFSAGAFWALCASSRGVDTYLYPVKGKLTDVASESPICFTEQLYYDKDAVVTEGTIRYTGKFQTYMDMVNSEADWSRVDEASLILYDEGILSDVVKYCLKHGLSKSKLAFALEGLDAYGLPSRIEDYL